MFIEALFIITEKRKQSACPPTNIWINKISYSQTMEYYSTKGNEERTHNMINLENIMLRKEANHKRPHIV